MIHTKAQQKMISTSLVLPILVGLILSGCSESQEPQTLAPAMTAVSDEAMEQEAQAEPGVGELLYVTNEDSNDLSVISIPEFRLLATIPVGKRPRGIKVSPDGKHIYVAVSGSPKCPPTMPDEECDQLITDASADGIAEVDAITRQVVRVLPSGSDPEQFDVDWENGLLYVSNENANQASVIDLEQGELLYSVPTGLEPEGVRLSPDGSQVYVTGEVDSDITIIDTAARGSMGNISVGLRPRDIVFSADGTTAYVSAEIGATIDVIDVASQSMVNQIPLPEGSLPMGMVLSHDGQFLYVANGRGRTVASLNLTTGQLAQLTEVGPRPWGLAMSQDGQYLFSANGSSDDVSVIDVETFAVITKIVVGETPWGVITAPAP